MSDGQSKAIRKIDTVATPHTAVEVGGKNPHSRDHEKLCVNRVQCEKSENSSQCQSVEDSSHNLVSSSETPILLETGQIIVKSENSSCEASVIIDRGSMHSYVTSKLADQLGLKPHDNKIMYVHGFGGHTIKKAFNVVNIGVQTTDGVINIDTLVSDEIVKPIYRTGWEKCLQLDYVACENLADNFQNKIFQVDVLIGCNTAYLFLENKIKKGNGPMLQFSNLGCFVSGPLDPSTDSSTFSTTVLNMNESCELLGSSGFNASPFDSDHPVLNMHDDAAFRQAYAEKIQFIDGEYHVPLPWKQEHPELPNNLKTSQVRLKQTLARLHRLGMLPAYCKVMEENINNGWVEEVKDPAALIEKDCYYLPHFFILKDSETTPLRIVFDASCGNPSLNSCVYEGPNMLNDLPELLALFRTGRVGVAADIARAFLSVKLLECDRKYVRFLWFKDNDPNKEIVPYHCSTVIFGNVSSPFSLAIVLSTHLHMYNEPVATDMSRKLYVDNVLTCVESEDEAMEYYHRSRKIMSDGSFLLRQWASNSTQLTEQAKSDNIATKSNIVSTLGLMWDTVTDTLKVAEKTFLHKERPTKRQVLSEMSSVFDPLGFVNPLIVPARKFVTELWAKGKSWDDPLSDDECSQWQNIRSSLAHVCDFQIPRGLGMQANSPVHLTVFCDSSPKTAAGCVAYLKQGNIVRLLGSKSKLIVNAGLTTPKSELQAMAIGARYGSWFQQTYATSFSQITASYLTDSEVALHWINSEKKLTQFVQNRVDQIKSKTELKQWFHVRSGENIADILSRGASADELAKSHWLLGPDWLCSEITDWPITQLSTKCSVSLTATVEIENTWDPSTHHDISELIDIKRFGDYNKLLRVSALVKSAFHHKSNELTAEKLNEVEQLWLKSAQKSAFSSLLRDLRKLQNGKGRIKTMDPRIRQLGLVLSADGIIRCAGRVRNHPIYDHEMKYPILLPKGAYLTKLIIQNAHKKVKHYGIGATMAEIRNQFWIASMRSTVRKVLNKCVICRKVMGRAYQTPDAPPLPKFRLDESKPYTATAIDFTGHLLVKMFGKIRKVYVCLFTCCATRHITLEIVEDMTTAAFLRAFRRFCSNHSTPSLVYCDNAKTFTSSEAELKRLYDVAMHSDFQNHLADNRIKFRFIPVQASWMAGVHERCIGTCKSALKKILGKAMICQSELQTIVKEIEAVVNNRPLTYSSSDLDELSVLTPNKLVYGYQIDLLPTHDIDEINFDKTYGEKEILEKIAFRRAQLITNFQTRFHNEYLASLRERHCRGLKKQVANSDSIKVGDVVIVYDKDKPRRNWRLGHVMELLTGPDGFTRAARVKTNSGVSNRAIAHLYPLEINTDYENRQLERTVPTETEVKRPTRNAAAIARIQIQNQTDV